MPPNWYYIVIYYVYVFTFCETMFMQRHELLGILIFQLLGKIGYRMQKHQNMIISILCANFRQLSQTAAK